MKTYKSPDYIPILNSNANGNEELCYEDVDANYLNDFFKSVSTVDDSSINVPPFQPVTTTSSIA